MIGTIAKTLYGSAQSLAAGHFKAEEGKVLAAQIKLAADHLSFTETKLEASEKDITKLEVKNETLEQELAKVKAELAKLDGSAKLIDIGPCYIKKDKDGNKLQGFYCNCNSCNSLLESFDKTYRCRKCRFAPDKRVVDTAFQEYSEKNPPINPQS